MKIFRDKFFGPIKLVLIVLMLFEVSPIRALQLIEPERYICDELSWLLDSQVEDREVSREDAEEKLKKCYNVFPS